MNENPCKQEVCPSAFAQKIDMDRKLQNNCKLIENDINELYSFMDEWKYSIFLHALLSEIDVDS